MADEHASGEKPFDIDYVLRTTTKHMRKSINMSIDKTYGRVAEFGDNPEKSMEVFKTLAVLHKMRKELENLQFDNLFKVN